MVLTQFETSITAPKYVKKENYNKAQNKSFRVFPAEIGERTVFPNFFHYFARSRPHQNGYRGQYESRYGSGAGDDCVKKKFQSRQRQGWNFGKKYGKSR